MASHQGTIAAKLLARDDVAAMVTKASEGTYYKHPNHNHHINAAKAGRAIPGSYHFLTNGNSGKQLGNFLGVAGDNFEGKLCMVDVEAEPYPDVDYNPRYDDVASFIEGLVRRIGDHVIMLYSGDWYWSGHLGNPSIAQLRRDTGARIKLWPSRYVTGVGDFKTLYAKVPQLWWEQPAFGGERPTILQFSGGCNWAGEFADANAFEGTEAELLALTRIEATVPKPPADTLPMWQRNWLEARAYMRRLVLAEVLYWFWDGGSLDRTVNGRPGCRDGAPPPVNTILRAFCADVLSLGLRAAGLAVPKNHIWPGGTRAFWLAYKSIAVPFKLSEMRDGDVAFRDFQTGGPDDEGHIMVQDEGKALQSFASTAAGEPGVNKIYTVAESHDGGYYKWRFPREKFWVPRR